MSPPFSTVTQHDNSTFEFFQNSGMVSLGTYVYGAYDFGTISGLTAFFWVSKYLIRVNKSQADLKRDDKNILSYLYYKAIISIALKKNHVLGHLGGSVS